jgi:hypothetical protein
MRRTGSPARRRTREIGRVAAVGAVLAATSLAAGAGAATGPQAVRASLAYTCAFPSGPRPASVLITATFPAAAMAGRPIQPADAAVAVTLAARDLAGLHATAVTGSTRLVTTAAQNGRSATATWSGLAIQPTPVPPAGRLILRASGATPPVTATAPGTVTVTATGLTLVLTAHAPGNTSANLATMQVRCTLNAGQNATLATVPVTGATSTPQAGNPGAIRSGGQITPQPRPIGSSSRATHACPPLPKGGLKLNPRFPPPPPPPGSTLFQAPYHGCTYVVGFSNVRKLNGASLVGPGLTNLQVAVRLILNERDNYFQQDTVGVLSYHGRHEFPPAKATFLAFRFMPVSATMQLTEIGTVNAVSVGPALQSSCHKPCPTISTVSSRVQLRIYNVTVNGTPLNVGPHCQTAPFDIVLTGRDDSNPPYLFSTGGPLTGTVTIPSFTGCGVGENLNPIFTSSVSGPGNFVKLTQGNVCQNPGTPSENQCPPEPPKPLR